MLPNVAVMLAAYMSARLIRAVVGPKKKIDGDQWGKLNLYLPDVTDIIAIAVVIYMACQIWTLGSSVTTEIKKAGIDNPYIPTNAQ